MSKPAWKFISYDVWGNKDEGWEVNAAYPTNMVYRIREKATDESILKTVWAEDANEVEIESWSDDQCVYFKCKETGEPLGEIRRIEE